MERERLLKMTSTDIRKALDEVLREADRVRCGAGLPSGDHREDHPWHQLTHEDCASHDESLNCCLDPGHGAYNELLDYLADRVASKLMYRGGAVTNVVATVGEELRPKHAWRFGDVCVCGAIRVDVTFRIPEPVDVPQFETRIMSAKLVLGMKPFGAHVIWHVCDRPGCLELAKEYDEQNRQLVSSHNRTEQ